MLLILGIMDRPETAHTCGKICDFEPPSSLQQIPNSATPEILFLGPYALDLPFLKAYLQKFPYLRLLNDVILRSFCSVRTMYSTGNPIKLYTLKLLFQGDFTPKNLIHFWQSLLKENHQKSPCPAILQFAKKELCSTTRKREP